MEYSREYVSSLTIEIFSNVSSGMSCKTEKENNELLTCVPKAGPLL